MKKILFAALIVVLSVVIVASFFMPWAKASVSVTKVAKGLAASADSTLKGTPFAGKFINDLNKATKAIDSLGNIEVKTTVSGYDIPTMVNKESSKTAVSLMQLFFKDAEGLGTKSMMVYLLPLFGLVCMALAVLGLKNKLAVAVMAIASGAIAVWGLYNLMTAKLAGESYQIVILQGLWQTMYAYLFIFILSVAWLATEKK
jgi:hypothetical protein